MWPATSCLTILSSKINCRYSMSDSMLRGRTVLQFWRSQQVLCRVQNAPRRLCASSQAGGANQVRTVDAANTLSNNKAQWDEMTARGAYFMGAAAIATVFTTAIYKSLELYKDYHQLDLDYRHKREEAERIERKEEADRMAARKPTKGDVHKRLRSEWSQPIPVKEAEKRTKVVNIALDKVVLKYMKEDGGAYTLFAEQGFGKSWSLRRCANEALKTGAIDGIVYINVDADFYSYKSGAAWFRSRLGIEDGMCGSVHDIFPPGMQVVLILDQFDTASHGVDVDPQYRKNFLVSLMGEAANFGNLRVFVATKDEEFANETHCYNGGTKFMKLELPPATQWTDSMLLNYASELLRDVKLTSRQRADVNKAILSCARRPSMVRDTVNKLKGSLHCKKTGVSG